MQRVVSPCHTPATGRGWRPDPAGRPGCAPSVARARTVQDMRDATSSKVRIGGQAALGATLAFAGVSHLTFQRQEFTAQVPPWVPLDADLVVLASGVVEIALGVGLLSTWVQPRRAALGAVVATFFVAVFPGNIAQLTERRDAFGLDSDTKRFVRLLFQPLLVVWAAGGDRCPPGPPRRPPVPVRPALTQHGRLPQVRSRRRMLPARNFSMTASLHPSRLVVNRPSGSRPPSMCG